MKAILIHCYLLLIVFSGCKSLQSDSSPSASAKFSYRKGVVVTHWTGVVAPRYMGQSNMAHTYGADWFDEEDVRWIAQKGFDHLQIDVDVRWWFSDDQEVNVKNIALYKRALEWANDSGLGVVLIFDIHPFASQPDPYDEVEIQKRSQQWTEISKTFLPYREGLRFHFGTHDLPLASDPGKRFLSFYQAIRKVDSTRFVYVPIPVDIDTTKSNPPFMNSPEGATFQHLTSLELHNYDKYTGISFNYFEPEVFIYQKPTQSPKVLFPGTVPVFASSLPDSLFYPNYLPMAKSMSGQPLHQSKIMKDFDLIAQTLTKQYPGREMYLENFGLHYGLDSLSSVNYIRAIKNSAEKNNISWCIYDYESGRAIRDSSGNPFPHFFGLDLPATN